MTCISPERRRGLLRASLLCGVLLLIAAGPAAAQIRGVVVDAAGEPVHGAVVESWDGQRRVDAADSDSAGGFRLGGTAGRAPLVLTVRRLGMRTRVMEMGPADSVVRVRMEAQALVMAPLVAASETRICPNRDDPRARMLWERMRSRYWNDPADSVRVFALVESWSGTVPREEIGSRDGASATAGWTESQPSRSLLDVRRSGYAWRRSGFSGERTEQWFYVHLDGGAWQHFTLPDFGALHTLSIVRAGAEGTVIGFCPRERMGRAGQIQGTLEVGADTTLAAAKWRFRTPRPVEDAGGEAVYQPPDTALHRLLLAEETLFWKRAADGRFYFEAAQHGGWRVMDGSFRQRDVFDAARPSASP